MSKERIIAPSVLSLDYSRMQDQIKELEASKAKWLHFDVMDGHFVPNLTFGPDILKGFDKATDLFLDVHLMVSDPEKYGPIFADAGADLVTFHTEALENDIDRIAGLIHVLQDKGIKAGFVVKPKTEITQFESLLALTDLVLVMSVEPGFGGQSFMEDQLEKVVWLRKMRDEKNLDYRIEIDGGISDKTYQKAVEAGCDTLVAGSYVFKRDICEAVESLLK